MKTTLFSPGCRSRSAGLRAKAILLGLAMVCAGAALGATTRSWTGNVSGFWSNPNNWDPIGIPQTGERLYFNDNSHSSMVNDLFDLSVDGLVFADHNWQLSGNALTLSLANAGQGGTLLNVTLGTYRSVTINCDLRLPRGGEIVAGGSYDDILTLDSTIYLYLNGRLLLDSTNKVYLTAESMGFVNGFGEHFINHGNIHVSGEIAGTGNVVVSCQEESYLEFNGSPANSFTGSMFIYTYGGGAFVLFNKPSGPVVNDALFLSDAAIVRYNQDNQVGDNATVGLRGGAQLLLRGHSDAIGSLIMTNFHADADATLVDTRNGNSEGTGLLTLNGGITSWVFNDVVLPTLRGVVSLPLGDHAFNMTSLAYAGFDMKAQVIGQGGFTKSGNAGLFLQASNYYSGLTVVTAGFVDARHVRAFGTGSLGVQLDGGGMILRSLSIATETLTVTKAGSLIETSGDCTWSGSITLNQQLSINSEQTLHLPGVIIGSGGLSLVGNTIELSGALPNSFTGPTRADCTLLSLNKSSGGPAYAMSGPLVIGQNSAAPVEVRWLGNWQINRTTTPVTLYSTALMNLNTHDDIIGSLTFNGGTVQNGGTSTLNLSQSVTSRVASVTANINGGRLALAAGNRDFAIEDGPLEPDLAISATVSDFGGITKTGLGALRLSAANTFLGSVNLNAGLVHIQTDTGLGSTAGSTTVADGATLQVEFAAALAEPLTLSGAGRYGTSGALVLLPATGGIPPIALPAAASVRVDSSFAILAGVISGPGSFAKLGAGALQLGGGSGSANTFTGDMIVSEGTLVLFKPPFVNAVSGNLVVGATNNDIFPSAALSRHFNPDQVGGGITVNRGGVLDLLNYDEYCTGLRLNGGADVQTGTGTLYLANDGANVIANIGPFTGQSVISGRLGLSPGTHRFSVSQRLTLGPPELDIPATIIQTAADANLVKDGYGAMRLGTANSFAGTMTIDGGQLIIANSAALGSTLGSITAGTIVNNDGSLALDGGLAVYEEALTLNSSNAAAFVSLGAFSNMWAAPITLRRTAGINVAGAGGVLNILSFFDCCGGSYISGPGGLTKTGPGKLLLAGYVYSGYDGPTTVRGGTLEAARFQGGSVRGDVLVDGVGSVLSTMRLNAFATASQLSSTGSVTLRNGAVWNLGPDNGESVRALLGDAAVNLSSGALLTVNPSTSNEFAGSFAGSGTLIKQGAGSFIVRGNSPSFTGPTTVSAGSLIVHGSMPGSAVTVNSGSLRGSGAVGGVTLASGTLAAPEPAAPPTIGVALTMSSLNGPAGSALQLDFAGTSSGGNDVARATTGGVTLGGALSPSFRYAPREGDVLTVIDKQSAGAVSGTFAGLPQNTLFTSNGIPARISYTGGTGNDVTLTVTNLALGNSGYRLAEGNGNQTIEPDECNLLYLSLVNRRVSSLTITSAVLRAVTPGALVTIANASYPVIPAGAARENLTPLQFRTTPTLACGTPVEFELTVGVVGEGVFAIAFTPVSGNDCAHPTGGCESCFTVSGSFSNATLTTTRPLDFLGAPSLCLPAKPCPQTNFTDGPAVRYVSYVFTNSATNEVCVTAQMRVDCANPLGVAAYLGTNDVQNPCVNYLGDSSLLHGSAFSFRVPASTNFLINIVARTTNTICGTHTLEVFGLPCPPPRLQIAQDAAPDKVRVSWSSAYPDYRLQSTNALRSSGPNAFGDVISTPVVTGGRYTVTNSATQLQQFFRLIK